LYDMHGRSVTLPAPTYQEGLVEIDCSYLSGGIYFIHVYMNEEISVHKVIKLE
jgi:hypothetical protein